MATSKIAVVDCVWTPYLNFISIVCDCGKWALIPSNHSVYRCAGCGTVEMWHGVKPTGGKDFFSEPVMRNELVGKPGRTASAASISPP